MTQSNTNSQSFTRTNAKYLASKIATNLKRIQRFYGAPSDAEIAEYELEAIEYLNSGYADKITYGYKRGDNWIEPTLIYDVQDLASYASVDDDPGNIRPNMDVSQASFTSFLHLSKAWLQLSPEEKEKFRKTLPFRRGTGNEPGIEGYLERDHTYSSGGKSLNRSSVKNFRS